MLDDFVRCLFDFVDVYGLFYCELNFWSWFCVFWIKGIFGMFVWIICKILLSCFFLVLVLNLVMIFFCLLIGIVWMMVIVLFVIFLLMLVEFSLKRWMIWFFVCVGDIVCSVCCSLIIFCDVELLLISFVFFLKLMWRFLYCLCFVDNLVL